jgi:hypothetical protein
MGLMAETRTSDSGLGAEGHWSIPGTAAYYKARGITPSTPSGGVNVMDVQSPFKQAIAALSGVGSDVEKTYQQGKRRTLSDIAMQSVNAGMANTINMPAAGIAYDAENRANTNVAVAGQKANLLGSMGQTMAGVYGTNVGAETSRSNALLGANTSMAESQLGANTSRANANLSYQANQNNSALQKYLGELELKYKYGGTGTTGSQSGRVDPKTTLYT